MGRPILMLRLEGPLQSWGIRARWDVRDTQPEPTKSGVVGLLGCALGYKRNDPRLAELDAGLRFGIRVEAPGRIVEDFHTITGFLPTAEGKYKHDRSSTVDSLEKLDPTAVPVTILSPRYYLEDAAFLVALEEQEGFEGLAARCAQALQKPVWPLYLGRKTCVPTRPVYEKLTSDYASLEEALESYPWSWLGSKNRRREPPQKELEIYVEDPNGAFTRQDRLLPTPIRLYGFRHLRRYFISPPTNKEKDI
jgi:CRISPR system Cascade subunit CasD